MVVYVIGDWFIENENWCISPKEVKLKPPTQGDYIECNLKDGYVVKDGEKVIAIFRYREEAEEYARSKGYEVENL